MYSSIVMQNFSQEFHTLQYVIKESDRILLFAHLRPDADTVGSVFALQEYIQSLGKKADVACFDPLPEYFNETITGNFAFPADLDLTSYKLIIACDAVERGFEKIKSRLSGNQVVAIIDHHPNIALKGDINISDAGYSSVCEIIYDFFSWAHIAISKKMAICLLLGILGDTGLFQHSNTTSKIIGIASELMKKGAPLPKIVNLVFANKNICTLKLWGKAFERAKINPANGMIASFLSKKDIEECSAGTEDVAQVSNILNTVPGTKFSLILSERNDGIIKGSLRSEEGRGVDVSQIAAHFGGGGHRLASGFEVKGKIVETKDGWEIK